MRTISLIFIIFSLALKFKLIHLSFINEHSIKYMLGFAIGLFIYAFLGPHIDLLFLDKKELEYNYINNIVPELAEKDIVFFSANMIFKPNAFVLNKKKPTIFIDNKIINNLSNAELRFILFHEYSHIKDNDGLKNKLSMLLAFTVVPLVMSILVANINLSSYPFVIILFVLIFVIIYWVGIILNFKYRRKRELKADKYAVNYVDKEDVISSFQKLIKLNDFDRKSKSLLSSHPPLEERLKNLRERDRNLI
ncbi:M48 family metallopeptidase [Staphylococcus sp. SQ8-PEA]|uniref:M48 family metallopeptidase n=1 Tax=Staphylococcus marylandisciuri TaxID=2981529 RepID=A0ABT2QN86_9STAP|nr:M48 family metallopeptidase [Staphylococcus marylandisciuri]MCU5745444.1 M48 family metallopeptidase [Staphylococcus marylandisciuri]